MSEPPEYATKAAVAGLARELDGLRHRLDEHATLPARLEQIAALVAALTDTVNNQISEDDGDTVRPVVSWLELAAGDARTAGLVLASLADWLDAVYLRYADAVLPECWLWHPDLVEELLWLRHAWNVAHHGKRASPAAVADWHDRMRPGVTGRIKHCAGLCSLENHLPDRRQPRRTVPQTEVIDVITDWWTTQPDQPPPIPVISRPNGRTHHT